MSWEDQGRQYHGYFGHGTVPKPLNPGEKEDDRFGPKGLIRRIVAVVGSLVAAAPRRERGWIERNHDLESRARLAYLMNAWIGGARWIRRNSPAYFSTARPIANWR